MNPTFHPAGESPFADKLWLAPLTRGGHMAFRRLCIGFGAKVTVGEMAVVKRLLQRRGGELALLRRHADETMFGAQLADRSPDTLARAARMAQERGAHFVDLNCGCPIHEITRRGLGSSLMRKPARLGRLVEAMRGAVSIPVTVKLRTGWSESESNVPELARVCEEAGAAAITVHGRSREQRYTKAADWDLIGQVAAERGIPVVGNGDILTHYEARERMSRSGVSSVMLARGALIRPWLFQEIRSGREWLPSAGERVGVLWRLVELMRDHFGDDERGRQRMSELIPWHQGFFCRYRPLPEAEYAAQALDHPLIQTRLPLSPELGPLDRLLGDPRPETHARIGEQLVEARDEAEALERMQRLAADVGDVPGMPHEPRLAPNLVAG